MSTEGATYMCLDVKMFYLGTPMESFEYMHVVVKESEIDVILYNLAREKERKRRGGV
jgi:hypothetical protein